MTNVRRPSLPFVSLNRDDLAAILYNLSDYIGVHEVIFDDIGAVEVARLVWWNEAYQKVRTKTVEFGQSMANTYYEHAHSAFVHVRAVCTESASNAIRHGNAKNVEISISNAGGNLHLSVADDGIGIDPTKPLHNGLNNMRQRAQSMGGTMKVKARDGGGTVIEWTVPHPGWES